MVTDVSFALIDAGISLEQLKFFADRHINKPSGVIPPHRESELHPGKPLTVSLNTHQPQYVHDNLPPFPDKHTYIQTAAQRMPSKDYQLVREKAANQKKTAETALTRFIAKTGDSDYYCDDRNDPINRAFPLIACKPTTLPYLSALLPRDDNEFEMINLLRKQESSNWPSAAKKIKTDDSEVVKPSETNKVSSSDSEVDGDELIETNKVTTSDCPEKNRPIDAGRMQTSDSESTANEAVVGESVAGRSEEDVELEAVVGDVMEI